MSLSSAQLDAFMAIAQTQNFSKAADLLFITQSALSQKIKILEESLGLTLFLRTSSGALLTEQGARLLRYCQVRDSLEDEVLQDLSIGQNKTAQKNQELKGVVRLAAYSSVLRSMIIPALAPFLEQNPGVQIEFSCRKMPELPGLLQRAEADFIVMDYALSKQGVVVEVLGQEKYVVIEAKKFGDKKSKSKKHEDAKLTAQSLRYLDNDAADEATFRFLAAQGGKSPEYTRAYFDDCYGIIDGVRKGLGRAVMPEHLVKNQKDIRILKGFKPYNCNIVLHYHEQPFYSRLHQAVIAGLALSKS